MNGREEGPLSRVELVVLARLSKDKPPTEVALGEAVAEVGLDDTPARALAAAVEALAKLRGRGWVNGRRALMDAGKKRLAGEFGLEKTPEWEAVRDEHLPAIALGMKPGSAAARAALGKKPKTGVKEKSGVSGRLAAAIIGAPLGMTDGPALSTVCDAILAKVLGLPPGRVTLTKIRACVLAQQFEASSAGTLDQVATRVAAASLQARPPASKKTITKALRRRWAGAPVAPGTQVGASIGTLPVGAGVRTSNQPQQQPPISPVVPSSSPKPEAVLAAVRDAIPKIGNAGRFGTDKIFVSALWKGIEADRRIGDLSLAKFKRWLLTANREQQLDLARSDLAGADAAMVAESEIVDRGATFHFVLDRRAGSGKANHAR